MGEAVTMAVAEQVDVERVRQQVQDLISGGKTLREIANAIGRSDSSLSQFLSGKYPGERANAMFAYRLQVYLDLERQRNEAPEKPGFAKTSIASDIWDVLDYARSSTDIGLVYGPAGIGKTMALKVYAQKHPDTIYIAARPSMRSPKPVIKKLLHALGNKQFKPMDEMVDAIIETLAGSRRLIIIDEAQHLTLPALEALRCIADETGCGIVLSGNKHIYDRMFGRGEAQFAQLWSRVGIRRHLQGPFPIEDVRLIFESSGRRLPEDCLAYLGNMANKPGGIRYVVKLYMLAANIAVGEDKPLDLDTLERARRLLMG